MPADRKQQIKRAIDEVAELDVPTAHPNVRQMAGHWAGCMRLRIGIYRAIFHVTGEGDGQQLEVLLIGPRGDIYG